MTLNFSNVILAEKGHLLLYHSVNYAKKKENIR